MIELFKSQVSSAILEMEWSAKCDCESSVKFSSKPGESPKKMELTDRETVEDGGELDAISFNLSGGSGVYGSDAGQVFSTKGSISTSSGSSPGDFKKKMEPLISLKLGKRTYFGNSHVQSSSSIARVSKRTKPSSQGPQIPRCQVEGCNLDLSSAKQYHKKHRVCDKHSKCPKVIVGGVERRFCQQCSRFHSLSEFDEKKRSCRRRLSDHNARRRNLTKLPSSCYDDGIQMNFVLNPVPLVHSKASANSSQDPHSSKFTITEEFTSEPEKTTGINKQPYISGIQLPNATAMHNNAWNWPLTTSKGTFAEIFNQGAKVPALPSNVCTMQEFARALSLLSTPSQGSFEPISISNGNHVHANQSYFPEPVMHAIIPQGLPPLASSEYWAGFNQFPWTYPPGCQY